jgi:hypothetical protein
MVILGREAGAVVENMVYPGKEEQVDRFPDIAERRQEMFIKPGCRFTGGIFLSGHICCR